MQDYKSLHVAVMICATMVNTDRQLLTGYTVRDAAQRWIFLKAVALYSAKHS